MTPKQFSEFDFKWECLRWNKYFQNDFDDYFKCNNPDLTLLIKLISKWGLFSYPLSRDYNTPWDEIKRKKNGITPASWSNEEEALLLDAYYFVLPKRIDNDIYFTFDHELTPFNKPIYLLRNEHEISPVNKQNIITNGEQKIELSSDMKIPERINITIHNFHELFRKTHRNQTLYRDYLIQYIKRQFDCWSKFQKNYLIKTKEDSDLFKQRQGFNKYYEYMKIYHLHKNKYTNDQIAFELAGLFKIEMRKDTPEQYKAAKKKYLDQGLSGPEAIIKVDKESISDKKDKEYFNEETINQRINRAIERAQAIIKNPNDFFTDKLYWVSPKPKDRP